MAQAPPILIYQPGGGVSSPIGSNPPVYTQAGSTVLIEGQQYVDVVFGSIQTDDEWVLGECVVVNELDVDPLNLWPGIITDKTAAGFRIYLNGLPDSGNYYLHWSVSGINIEPSEATSYTLSGPATGAPSEEATFTVALPASTFVNSAVTVTPSEGGLEIGVFSPETVTLTTDSPSATFTFTPALYGETTIVVNNDRGLSDPADLIFNCTVDTYEFSGPSGGPVGVASTDFTVELPVGGVVVGTVTVTPSDGGGGGTFTPTTVALTTLAPSDTFTYTPASSGAKTLSVSNNGGLTDPVDLTYTPAVGYTSTLTIDHTKVSGTQTDFPVLVDITDAVLKTVANGGNVENANGYDIGFFADSGGTTPLDWEIDRYTALTGHVIAWVKIPSLSSSVDTVFYIRYGDDSIVTDQSDPVNTWSNGFVAVYHYGNGVTLSVADSKGAFNGTNHGGTAQPGGQINGAAYTLPVNYISAGAPVTVVPLTISCWAYVLGAGVITSVLSGSTVWNGFYLSYAAGPLLQAITVDNNFASSGIASQTSAPSVFQHYVGVFSAINSRIAYVNAVAGTTETTSVTPSVAPTDLTVGAAKVSGAIVGNADVVVDELRIANVARSGGWITTEYNNQNAPGTFMTFIP